MRDERGLAKARGHHHSRNPPCSMCIWSPKPLPVRCRMTNSKTSRMMRPTVTFTQRGVGVVALRAGLGISASRVRRKKSWGMELPFSFCDDTFVCVYGGPDQACSRKCSEVWGRQLLCFHLGETSFLEEAHHILEAAPSGVKARR